MVSPQSPPRGGDLEPYDLPPLPTTQHVRILNLIPASSVDNEITCYLEPHPDPKNDRHGYKAHEVERHGYEALSWCWGGDKETSWIRINDSETHEARYFQVSKHLCDALRALRHHKVSRFLWIDAICINQSDVGERNKQVARMSEIYGNARNVCIWLGTDTQHTQGALEFIKNKVLDVYAFDQLINHHHVENWKAMLEVMKRPWFLRRWVVQEVALAQKATVYYGSENVDWEDFGAAVSLLVDVESSVQRLSEIAKKDDDSGNEDNYFDELPIVGATTLVSTTNKLFKRSVGGIPQRTSRLEDIVAHLAMFESTEPRDTVYAILALAKDSQPSVEGIPDYLESEELSENKKKALTTLARLLPNPLQQRYNVDYNQRALDVYQQFISFAVTKGDPTRALDIICRPFAQPVKKWQDVSFSKELKDSLEDPDSWVVLPSWILSKEETPFAKKVRPRKSNTRGTELVTFMERQRGDPFVSTPDTVSYSAAGSKALDPKKIRFRKRAEQYTMFVEGFVLDVIQNVEEASQLGNIPGGWFERAKKNCERQNDPDAFWKTLVADRSPKGAAPKYYKNAIETALGKANSDFDVAARIRVKTSEIISDVLRHVQATIWNRRLIETRRGLLGLGPSKVRKGDLVCILYGCSVPVILRKRQKTPDEMNEEREADARDREERMRKVTPLLKRVFRRERERQRNMKADIFTSGQPPSSQGTTGSLKAQLQSPMIRLVFFMAVYIVMYGLRERFAANVLAALAAPHLLQELGDEHLLVKYIALPIAAVAILTALAMSKLDSTLWGWYEILAVAIMAPFDAIFPELLPQSLARSYMGILQTITHRSADLLRRSTTALGQQPTSHQIVLYDPDAHAVNARPERGANIPDPPASPTSPTVPVARVKLNLLKGPVDPPLLHCYYKVVGESYIHKMMHGEAIRWQNEHAFSGSRREVGRPEIFELR